MELLLSSYYGSGCSTSSLSCAAGGLTILYVAIVIIALVLSIFAIVKTYTIANRCGRNAVLWVIFSIITGIVALAIISALAVEDIDDSIILYKTEIAKMKVSSIAQEKKMYELEKQLESLKSKLNEENK